MAIERLTMFRKGLETVLVHAFVIFVCIPLAILFYGIGIGAMLAIAFGIAHVVISATHMDLLGLIVGTIVLIAEMVGIVLIDEEFDIL